MSANQEPCLIRGTKAEFGCLGNMSPHSVRWPVGLTDVFFHRAEMLFQALRFEQFGPVWNLLVAESNPMKSKFLAKAHAHEMIIAPRGEQDVAHMATVLRLKTSQNPDVRDVLLGTGDRLIIEDCSKRRTESGLFWGAALEPDGTWTGANMFGELWMVERQRLRDEQK